MTAPLALARIVPSSMVGSPARERAVPAQCGRRLVTVTRAMAFDD
jgi:hypothetical protein